MSPGLQLRRVSQGSNADGEAVTVIAVSTGLQSNRFQRAPSPKLQVSIKFAPRLKGFIKGLGMKRLGIKGLGTPRDRREL